MSNTESSLRQGINAFKAGDKQKARGFLLQAVREEPNNEHAWGWLSNTAENEEEKIHCLRQVVKINPQNNSAKKLLSDLEKKQKPTNIFFGLAAIIALCICCFAVIILSPNDTDDKQTAAATRQPIPFPNLDFDLPNPPVARNYIVEYKVLGSGQASITYENSTGDTEQLDTSLSWSYPRFYAKTGQFLYVSAQIQSIGEVTCMILVNGARYKKSTSKGQYVICTASTSAP